MSGHSLVIAGNMFMGTVFIIQEGRTTMPVLHPPPPPTPFLTSSHLFSLPLAGSTQSMRKSNTSFYQEFTIYILFC